MKGNPGKYKNKRESLERIRRKKEKSEKKMNQREVFRLLFYRCIEKGKEEDNGRREESFRAQDD